jgi:putative serine protease PepD
MNLRPASPRLRRILPLAIAAAIGTAVGAGTFALTSGGSGTSEASPRVVVPAQPASSTSTVDSLTQLYKQDAPGIVDITVTSSTSSGSGGTNPFGLPGPQGSQKQEAEGTGFEIDTKGDILTAAHVVEGAQSVTVHFQDGSSAKATVVGKDRSTDTAVIHVDVSASQLHPLALGSSANVQPGQSVVAIGSPFGLPETMTAGIVSATNRTITAPNRFSITGAIQTDAAINHGNSGGPLIDAATNTVIGINDQIESDTNDNAGIGFAVPIDSAQSVAQTLIAGGTVRHAYVGVHIAGVSGGARITDIVPGSPAAKAGLEKGDLITSFDGKPVTSADVLTTAVFDSEPGQKVTVTIRRDGATKHLSLTLGVQPTSPSS